MNIRIRPLMQNSYVNASWLKLLADNNLTINFSYRQKIKQKHRDACLKLQNMDII